MEPLNERIKTLRLNHGDEQEGPPDSKRRLTPVWLALAAFFLGIGAVVAWGHLVDEPVVVQTVVAEPLDAPRQNGPGAALLEASGQVVARRQATVSATLTARLIEILYEEGVEVEEGQLLARLDDSRLQALLDLDRARLSATRHALAETEVALAEAELELNRTRRLFEEKIASEADLDTADAKVRTLRARLVHGREQVAVAERQMAVRLEEIEETRIRAPFAGVVISQNAQLGEMVSPVSAGGGFTRTGICTLADMASLEAEVEVSENYISRIRPGLAAEVVLDAHPGAEFGASVIAIVPAADPLKATFRVRLAFDRLDPRIMPNMRLKVRFLSRLAGSDGAAEQAEPAAPAGVLIPSGALKETAEGYVVYLVRDRTLTRRRVTPGAERDEEVLILDGLEPDERVVFPIPPEAGEGMTVEEERTL